MSEREIEMFLERARKAARERRNAELRARLAARTEKGLLVLRASCGLNVEERRKAQTAQKIPFGVLFY